MSPSGSRASPPSPPPSPRAESAAYWLALFGGYGSSASLLLAAILGTSSATPIAGAGHSAPAWQEAMVNLGLQSTAAAMLSAACCSSGASAAGDSGGMHAPDTFLSRS